ncbi:uncharacterized protein LOC144549065 [Carex rostrata]
MLPLCLWTLQAAKVKKTRSSEGDSGTEGEEIGDRFWQNHSPNSEKSDGPLWYISLSICRVLYGRLKEVQSIAGWPTVGETLSLWYRQLAYSVHMTKEVQVAKEILRYAEMGNFKLFFSTVAMDLTNLQFSLIEPFLDDFQI